MRRLIPLGILLAIAASAVVGFAASLNVDSARLTVFSNALATTSLDLTLSDPGPVESGASVSVDAGLQGATSDAGGSVYYNVYSDSSCGTLYATAGSSSVTNGAVDNSSDSVTFSSPGSYFWQASYSGDGENRPSISTCGDTVLVVIESEPQESEVLYLDMSDYELVTDDPSGDVDLLPQSGNPTTWDSDDSVIVGSSSGWVLKLEQSGPSPFSGAQLHVDLWVSSGSCDGTPSSSDPSYIAGRTLAFDDHQDSAIRQISLTANSSFAATGAAQTLCLQITNTYSGGGGPHEMHIVSGDDTYVDGPFSIYED